MGNIFDIEPFDAEYSLLDIGIGTLSLIVQQATAGVHSPCGYPKLVSLQEPAETQNHILTPTTNRIWLGSPPCRRTSVAVSPKLRSNDRPMYGANSRRIS